MGIHCRNRGLNGCYIILNFALNKTVTVSNKYKMKKLISILIVMVAVVFAAYASVEKNASEQQVKSWINSIEKTDIKVK